MIEKLHDELRDKFALAMDQILSYELTLKNALESLAKKESSLDEKHQKAEAILQDIDAKKLEIAQALNNAKKHEEAAEANKKTAEAYTKETLDKKLQIENEALQIHKQQESIAERERLCRQKEKDIEMDARKLESLERHVQRIIEDRQIQKEIYPK